MRLPSFLSAALALFAASPALFAVAKPTPTTTNPSPVLKTRAVPGCDGTLTKFKHFGVNQSGAEFGQQNIPGLLGRDYTWPSPSSVDVSLGFILLLLLVCLEEGAAVVNVELMLMLIDCVLW